MMLDQQKDPFLGKNPSLPLGALENLRIEGQPGPLFAHPSVSRTAEATSTTSSNEMTNLKFDDVTKENKFSRAGRKASHREKIDGREIENIEPGTIFRSDTSQASRDCSSSVSRHNTLQRLLKPITALYDRSNIPFNHPLTPSRSNRVNRLDDDVLAHKDNEANVGGKLKSDREMDERPDSPLGRNEGWKQLNKRNGDEGRLWSDEQKAVEHGNTLAENSRVESGRTTVERKDKLNTLPQEILCRILELVPIDDVLRSRLVSKNLSIAADSQLVWKALYLSQSTWGLRKVLAPHSGEMNWPRISDELERSFKKSLAFSSPTRNNARSPTATPATSPASTVRATSPIGASPGAKSLGGTSIRSRLAAAEVSRMIYPSVNWKNVYRERLTLEERWKTGKPTSTAHFTAHDDAVYCSTIIENKLITGGRDRKIRIWTITYDGVQPTDPFYEIKNAHSRSVLCLQIDPIGGRDGGGFMVTGSSDRTVGVWELRGTLELKHARPFAGVKGKPKKIRSLKGHQDGVLDVVFSEDVILSCSKDATIRIWSRRDYRQTRLISTNHIPVNCLEMYSHTKDFIAALGDGAIVLFNQLNKKVEKKLRIEGEGLAAIQLEDDCLFYGTRVNRLGKMSIPEGVRETYLTGHLDLIRTIAGNAKTGRLVTGSYDRTVILWDLKSGTEIPLHVVEHHESMVFTASVDCTNIVSGSHDRTIIMRKFGGGLMYAPYFL